MTRATRASAPVVARQSPTPIHRRIPLPATLFTTGLLIQQLALARRKTSVTAMIAAGIVVGISANIGIESFREFSRCATSHNPLRPERAAVLVTTGPNRYSRNPMYLALAGTLTAGAIARRCPLALVPVGGFIAAVSAWQIRQEEATLTSLFPHRYARYCQRVPRWFSWRRALG
ncbi:MAG: isoprenylcysteine carboxylmethyltransferase family protein [Bowdeniella nasicola]|nr:isoprenylcysteine carboxylmethyltransferase family protein [Bowdeniella nasicola]